MQKHVLFFCFCAAFSSLVAQNIKIKGSTVENAGQAINPLTGVSAALLREDSTFVTGTASDGKGRFSLEGVKPGDYHEKSRSNSGATHAKCS